MLSFLIISRVTNSENSLHLDKIKVTNYFKAHNKHPVLRCTFSKEK